MITWFTHMSMFDSAAALELPQLAQSFEHAEAMFNILVFDEAPDVEAAVNHLPLLRMWIGYETYLAAYAAACAVTLVSHGVTATARALALAQSVEALRRGGDPAPLAVPPWLSDVDVLRSHRSNLMRRWPESYSWPKTPSDLPYLWPVVDDEGGYALKLSKYDRELIAKGERTLPRSIAERIAS
jgi:hypothetical protein